MVSVWSRRMSPSTTSAPRDRLRHRRIPGPPADPVKARLLRLYRALRGRFGPQHWWPGRTPYEIAVGAVLTQHTAWTNAARAVAALRARRLLRPDRVAALSEPALARLIRSPGTYRLKARRLRAFTRWLLGRFGGRWDRLRRAPLVPLRRGVPAGPGARPGTGGAVLPYAAGRPVFGADAPARRVLARHPLLTRRPGLEDAPAVLGGP